jgi:hypothetical protein
VEHKALAILLLTDVRPTVESQAVEDAVEFQAVEEEPSRGIRSATPEEVKKLWRDRPRNTQRSSTIRSDINDGVEIRDIPCLRCARDISEFLHLQYWTSPNSVAGKCGDCVHKHGFCYNVSFKSWNQSLGSLATYKYFANDPLDS